MEYNFNDHLPERSYKEHILIDRHNPLLQYYKGAKTINLMNVGFMIWLFFYIIFFSQKVHIVIDHKLQILIQSRKAIKR